MQWSIVFTSCFILSCEGCIGPRPSPSPPAPPASSCTRYGPSPASPSDVSQLRPGDIGILAAIGDSDSAAFGARATSLVSLDYLSEARDISFVSGTSTDYETQTSLFNMLLQYNPALIGGSPGSNSVILPGNDASKGLNLAVSGAWAGDAPGQAETLVTAIQQVPGWEDKWKLITVQLFGNDICVASCGEGGADYEGDATPEGYKSNLKTALTILMSALPKTLIVLTAPYDPTKIADITNKHFGCQFLFPTMCPCLSDSSRPGLVQLRTQYEDKLVELAAEMRSELFGVEVIPAMVNLYPEASSGGPDPSFLAPDCYHQNAELHSMIGKNIWNNLVEKSDERTSYYGEDLELVCPARSQFLSTTTGVKKQPALLNTQPSYKIGVPSQPSYTR